MIDVTTEKNAAEAMCESERDVLAGCSMHSREHVAVVRDDGVIEAVNLPWQRFAEENGTAAAAVSVCEST